ncbi:unnamed protein product, partial [Psylliodes chrysocephalus]
MSSASTSQVGRPSLSFEESSERTKRRKIEQLRSEAGNAEITYALKMNLRAEGKHDAVKILGEALEASPNRAAKMLHAWQESHRKPIKYTSDESLSLMIEAKLTKHQYNLICSHAKIKNADIYL